MTLTNYWWLLIWLFTGGLALAAYFPKHREMVCGKIETRWGVVPAVLMAVPYIVWAGYRSDAFGDTAAYRGAFKDAPSSFSEMSAYLDTIMKDKGFYGLVAALKSLFHVSDIGCFMLLAGFQLLVIVWLYRKYSSFYWFSFFLFIASTDYMSWAQNGVRQFLAVTIALLATPFMLKKKYIPAILLIILASTMHQSALLMIPLMFIAQGKPWNRRTILFLLGTKDEEGTNIVYRVTADAPEEYTAKVTGSADDGFVVTYTHEIAKTSVTASVEWDDADDKDGIRPKSVSFQLKADGENVGDAITVNAGSNWTKTWEDLPEKKAGKALTYTVEVSDIPTEEDQYTVTTSGDAASGFVFKASHVSTSVEIPVSVTWDDAENQDGARIEAVEAELYANGEATGNKVTLNAENNWTAKFASVDVKKDGTRIKYEVKGTEADGYDVSVAGDILDEKGLVLTYKHIPAVVNVSARVSWNDANNQDGIRPTDTLVQLYADGTALGDKAVIESNKEWTKTWSNLPKYKAGKEIAYNVIAYAVSGYTVKVTGNVLEGYKAEYTHNVQKMNVTVQNAWNDLDNVVDSRPAQLVVEIYANGKTTGKRVTLTEANNWKATVSGLDRNAAGKRIQYTGKAVGTPAGYNISVSTDTNGNIKLISNFTTYTKKLRLKLSKTSYVYNGKNAKPKVTVYNGRKKVSSKYYKVTYKNNKKVGYATVIVKGKGKFAKYAGKAAFTIKLKTLKKPSVKKGAKGTLNVSWKRDGQATKYVVQYSQSKKFKGKSTKTVTITNNKIGKTVLKGLTGKKNYYVRVRSCKAVNGREIWSSWSSRSSKVKVK